MKVGDGRNGIRDDEDGEKKDDGLNQTCLPLYACSIMLCDLKIGTIREKKKKDKVGLFVFRWEGRIEKPQQFIHTIQRLCFFC